MTEEKWGILAQRAGGSRLGVATAWCKDRDGQPLLFSSQYEAMAKADEFNGLGVSGKVSWIAARYSERRP